MDTCSRQSKVVLQAIMSALTLRDTKLEKAGMVTMDQVCALMETIVYDTYWLCYVMD